MQNDLISRSALIAHIGDLGIDPEDDTTFLTTGQACAIAHKCIVEMVKEEPAVDAVEVGSCDGCHWKEIGRQQKCSCCRRNRYLKDCYEGSV